MPKKIAHRDISGIVRGGSGGWVGGIGLTMESRLEQELPAAVLSLPLMLSLIQPPYNVYGLIFDTMHLGSHWRQSSALG